MLFLSVLFYAPHLFPPDEGSSGSHPNRLHKVPQYMNHRPSQVDVAIIMSMSITFVAVATTAIILASAAMIVATAAMAVATAARAVSSIIMAVAMVVIMTAHPVMMVATQD